MEFAERVGIDRSFLAHVERGKRNVSILNLELIAKGLYSAASMLFRSASAMLHSFASSTTAKGLFAKRGHL
jgi:transcriptional regulator with XRE-family HTH domain